LHAIRWCVLRRSGIEPPLRVRQGGRTCDRDWGRAGNESSVCTSFRCFTRDVPGLDGNGALSGGPMQARQRVSRATERRGGALSGSIWPGRGDLDGGAGGVSRATGVRPKQVCRPAFHARRPRPRRMPMAPAPTNSRLSVPRLPRAWDSRRYSTHAEGDRGRLAADAAALAAWTSTPSRPRRARCSPAAG